MRWCRSRRHWTPSNASGFEVRDVESVREHYGQTLRESVDNLRLNWAQATELVGEARVRTWLLYLAACALAFEHDYITVHRVLAVHQGEHGSGGIPATRNEWLTASR